MKLYIVSIVAALFPYFPTNALGDSKVLSGVPAYTNYHGCEPTSIAMIMGYWDMKGYSNLLIAEGNAVLSTVNVQDEISSPAHNAKYDPTPDDPNLPVPEKTSIADWLGTSVNGQPMGGSSATKAGAATVCYAVNKGYIFTTASTIYCSTTWATLLNEIDAGRPMLFIVDAAFQDGILDHVIPVFGYDDNHFVNGFNDGQYYACYTTGDENETPVWYKFRPMAVNTPYGVYGVVAINPGVIPMVATSNTGVKQIGFGFTITGPKNMTVLVEACTDLSDWQQIATPLLSSTGTYDFVDPNWTSYAKRFYRVHWP
jgi:hypothetical protein